MKIHTDHLADTATVTALETRVSLLEARLRKVAIVGLMLATATVCLGVAISIQALN